MKKLRRLTCVPSVLLALTLGSTALAQEKLTVEKTVSIGDRHSAIADVVSTWGAKHTFARGWEAEFTAALNGANDKQLHAIQNAENYDQVKAILQGRVVPVALGGVAGAEALGDITSDLLYSPVVPCRFFDTRFDNVAGPGHTTGSTATTHSYQVYGTANDITHQGYNKGVNSGAGCPAPKGEPVAIAANFTAAGPLGNGNIRVWPFGGSLPNVSLVNYSTGTNIANAAIIATGYLMGADINVTMQFGTVDALGDVTGYFYPVDTNDPAFNQVDNLSHVAGGGMTTLFPTSFPTFIGPIDTATIPNGGIYKVLINAVHSVGTTTAASGLDIWPCYHQSPYSGTPTVISGGMFDIKISAARIPIAINGVVSLTAGEYRFGMCYRTSNTEWNDNYWGYVSILVVRDN